MADHFADRLLRSIREKNAPACVGLDPLLGRLPPAVLRNTGIKITGEGFVEADVRCDVAAEALLTFGQEVIHIVAPHVPAIKINIAFFEPYYADGIRTYFALVRHALEAGLVVIGDVKRADIGHSCDQYARAQFGVRSSADVTGPDAVTVNPYFGFDAIRPFADIARDQGRGLFVLVQTSNPSAVQVQGLALSDGSTLCQRVARIVQSWAMQEGFVGHSNYSCIGAVVSPRDLSSTECIRSAMPNCLFLVPGFGAQGRTPKEVARCFKPDGTGAIVTASRSVIYAYRDARYRDVFGDDWRRCVEQGCQDFVHAIRSVLPS